MRKPTVLISGAGIAGLTLAHWLARGGLQPTIVERATDLRSSGNPVDVRGEALAIVGRMGVLPQLREASTRVTRARFVDRHGRSIGGIGTGGRPEDIEVSRGDLAAILSAASRDSTELIPGDTIAAVAQDPAGADVTFTRAAPRRFDAVVGADGLHSGLRKLCFGPEPMFVRHLGLLVATMTLPREGSQEDVVVYNEPGRAVAIHPAGGRPGVAFMFRGRPGRPFDPHDLAQQRRMLADAYAGAAWRVPELLARADTAPDLWMDLVSRVRVPCWSRGRVVLVGDAASCVSLFGEGSSMAIIGAATLAEALAATPGTPATAFAGYEGRHRPLVESRQRAYKVAAAVLIPATAAGLAARNLLIRLSAKPRRR